MAGRKGCNNVDEGVVARPTIQHVLSTDAEQGIVASATQDGFVTGAADQNVVTIATVDKQLWTRVAEI